MIAGLVQFVTRVGYTPYREYRVWQNRPDVRFRNLIHETMVPDLLRIRDAEGLAINPVPLQIQHYGYEGDQRPKHERNLPLLLEQVRHEPRRVYLWWHLGTVHAGLGQMDQARAAFEHGLQIVREDGLKSATNIVVYCEVAFRRALDGQPVEDLVAEGLGLDPGCQPLRAAALVAAQHEGRWDRVEELAGVLLAAARPGTGDGTVSFDGAYWSSVALQAVAQGRRERGDATGALTALEELARLEPGNTEVRSKAAATRAVITPGQ